MQAANTDQSDIHTSFGRLIAQAGMWLEKSAVSVLHHDILDVRLRLTQRLIELTFIPFAQSASSDLHSNQTPYIRVAGITIAEETGSIRLSPAALGRAASEYFAHWGLTLLAILSGFRPQPETTAATLVYGVDVSKDGDARFVDYCQNGTIQPLKDAKRLLIQSTSLQGALSNERWQYVKYPHLALVAEARLGVLSRLRLLLAQLVSPLAYLAAILRFTPLALLGRDFALGPVMQALTQAELIEACVFTNTNGKVQPLWMRGQKNFQVHMVWYSQNTRLHQYKNQSHEPQNPHIAYVSADVHWVWTEGYRDHLLGILKTAGDIKVVGPILWYLPKPLSIALERPNIAVFDVIPVTSEAAFRLGLMDSYFSSRNAQKFLTDIVDSCNRIAELTGRPPQIYLKHKREAASPLFDNDYLDLVAELASTGQILLLDPQENIFGMLAASDVCVAIPYTSPVYVATSIGTPAIYYDPTHTLQPNFEQIPGLQFASEQQQLESAIMNCLTQKPATKAKAAYD